MTLTKYNGQYEELFSSAVLWWPGSDQTSLGFPILPSGVTVTPNGTWSNDLDLGNNNSLKTFNGSTNYISLSDNDAWNFGSGDFTISLWYKPTSATLTGTKGLMGQVPEDGGVTNTGWSILIESAVPRFYYHNGTTCVGYSSTCSSFIADVWYHISCIKTSSTLYFFINGISCGSVALSTINNSSLAFLIGDTGYFSPVGGNIKDLMIFKGRALTQPEIITIMRKTHPTNAIGDFRPTLSGIRGVE